MERTGEDRMKLLEISTIHNQLGFEIEGKIRVLRLEFSVILPDSRLPIWWRETETWERLLREKLNWRFLYGLGLGLSKLRIEELARLFFLFLLG